MARLPDFTNRLTRVGRTPATSIVPGRIFTPTVDIDAVFEGGATLGAAYVGSLNLLENARVRFRRVAGNSAGAITAALVAAGYTAAEVEWQMSNVPNPRVVRPASLPPSARPIDFMDLLDIPTVDQITVATMRTTQLWKALKATVIDEVLKTRLPIPTRGAVVDDIVAELKQVPVLGLGVTGATETAVRTMLRGTLSFLPTSTPRLSDFSLFDETAGLRTAFADNAWRAIASQFPLFLMSTNFLHEGGLFEGDEFRSVLDDALRAKIGGGAPVQFRDLPIPLAVIAYDYDTGRMVVYSTLTQPRMEVAEAVRRSMSIPLLWQARKRDPFNNGSAATETIVDGGLASNFPIWLFTPVGDQYWPPASIDPARPKVGFSLDENLGPPAPWGAGPGKFALTGTPPHVDFWSVVRPVLVAKLKEGGLALPNEATVSAELDTLTYLKVAFGALGADKEQIMRDTIVTQLMTGLPFHDVVIPLLGYHGFDFSVNSDRDDLDGIAERGFLAARAVLGTGSAARPALLPTAGTIANPYA